MKVQVYIVCVISTLLYGSESILKSRVEATQLPPALPDTKHHLEEHDHTLISRGQSTASQYVLSPEAVAFEDGQWMNPYGHSLHGTFIWQETNWLPTATL